MGRIFIYEILLRHDRKPLEALQVLLNRISLIHLLKAERVGSCAKCVVMMSAAGGLERQTENNVKLVKMNITTTQGLAKNLDVRSTPTFLIYENGKEIQRFHGDNLSIAGMEDFIQNII